MIPKLRVEMMLLRLMAAFPTFKMPAPTQALYVEKLSTLEDDDLSDSVEHFIEKGGKFPPIGLLRTEAAKRGHARRKKLEQIATEERRRTGISSESVEWGDRHNTPLFREAFERGRQRAERQLASWLRGDGCDCERCKSNEEFRRNRGA